VEHGQNRPPLPGQLKALHAIRHCRTSGSGEILVKCPDCNHYQWHSLSCGHRNCPQCQNIEATKWIDLQHNKLLPILYFMVTFYITVRIQAAYLSSPETGLFDFFRMSFQHPQGFWIKSEKLGAHKWQ
jgi:hypothetical protein